MIICYRIFFSVLPMKYRSSTYNDAQRDQWSPFMNLRTMVKVNGAAVTAARKNATDKRLRGKTTLAEMANVSPKTLKKAENGEEITLVKLKEIANVLETPVEAFIINNKSKSTNIKPDGEHYLEIAEPTSVADLLAAAGAASSIKYSVDPAVWSQEDSQVENAVEAFKDILRPLLDRLNTVQDAIYDAPSQLDELDNGLKEYVKIPSFISKSLERLHNCEMCVFYYLLRYRAKEFNDYANQYYYEDHKLLRIVLSVSGTHLKLDEINWPEEVEDLIKDMMTDDVPF